GPNEEVDFTLEFTARLLGEDKAILRVSSDDATAPWVDFIVTGTGVAPGIASVIADNGSFGSVATSCGFADLPLTINNPGACDLYITNLISDNGQFLAPRSLTYPLVIHPGDSMN